MAVRFGGDVYLFGIKVVDMAPEGAFVFGQAAYGLAGGAIRRFTGASCDFFISNDRCDEEDMRVGADIEDNPLGQQRHVPGPSMIEEAIDGDSPDAVRAEARRRESEALTGMDGLDLADVELMRHAWRCHDADPDVVCAVAGRNPESHSREGAR